MPLKKWIKSANNAINGIIEAARTERHLRYHFYSAILVFICSLILDINRYDFLAISIIIIIVLLAEMINTSIEYVVDLITEEYNVKAKAAKDVAAGAVLVTAAGAVVIGYLILFPYLKDFVRRGIRIAHHGSENIAMVAIVITIIIVIITKAYFKSGQPLRGGMPSGHAAVAFSIWMTVTLVSKTFLSSLLVFILAVVIAYSRVSHGIHRPIEVVVGALLGTSITYLLFLLFT
ncbi:MAG: phosphatase PAP2 family protein [Nitrospirae bacterium]|nr:MAG: phosphatase PAP2 family protein [Nitrospirota bacterium]